MKIPEIIRVKTWHKPGSLARMLTVIGDAGLVVEGLKAVRRDERYTTWEVTLEHTSQDLLDEVVEKIHQLPNAEVLGRSDRVFARHKGGKTKVVARAPIHNLERLRDVYTPGVARVCLTLQEEPERAYDYTSLGSTVAIVTNGTAVLGLGHIGALAGLPVMEGKAALMAELAELSGIPILIESQDPQVVIDTVMRIAPSFGAIQLEDIAAPECFQIEEALIEQLDKPVMHDDQHGTAVVTLAALLGATRRASVQLEGATVGQVGLGAAGLGICRLLLHYGVKTMLGADLDPGALQRLEDMGGTPSKLEDIMREADVVVATTGVAGLIKPEMVRKGQVILALSNPEPEIEPDAALDAGASYATDGKVVNNVLGFPGIFRGALDARATRITVPMLVAAAEVLSTLAHDESLVPDPLDKSVHQEVAAAVRKAAGDTSGASGP